MTTISKIISTSLFLIILYSCNQEKQLDVLNIVKDNTKEYLIDKSTDLSSYEFVSLKIIDTISYQDNINIYKDLRKRHIEIDENIIKTKFEGIEFGPDEINEMLKLSEENLISAKIFLKRIDSIELSLGKKVYEDAAYLFLYSFRAKSISETLVLYEYYLQVSAIPDYSILNLTNDSNKLLITPNGFPGLQELY